MRHSVAESQLWNRTHSEVEDDQDHDPAEQRIPTAWWVGGLLVSGAFCTALLTPMLDLPVIDPLAAVGLALLVAVLAVRALGQTDLNPVSGVGKLSQVRHTMFCFLIRTSIYWYQIYQMAVLVPT